MPPTDGTKEAGQAILQCAGIPADGVDDVRLIRRVRTPAGTAATGQSLTRDPELQAGILPWRRKPDGLQLLLITSRGGNRWIIPKGWPMPRKTLRESACQEAYEEAGVRGRADPKPVGSFITDKTDFLGRTRQLEVVVYAMEVGEELSDWPEKGERQRRWCTGGEAISTVETDSLRMLIESFVNRGSECTVKDTEN